LKRVSLVAYESINAVMESLTRSLFSEGIFSLSLPKSFSSSDDAEVTVPWLYERVIEQ
jgi:hypothetical protein